MSQSVNGYPQGDPYNAYLPSWAKYTDVRQPPLGRLFVLIDENEDTIVDAEFGNPVDSPYFEPDIWWDMPANRHNQGANLSFADGHVEHWKWLAPMIFYDWLQPLDPAEMPDYQRLQNAMRQFGDN
jgi:prepilin-type processing-associated H-X9-DG protein